MNWLDFAVIALLAGCILQGIHKGFVRTGIDFLMMIAGLVCGLWFYIPFSFVLRGWIRPKELAQGIAFLLIFAAMMVADALLQAAISRFMKGGAPNWFDRLLGGGFGVIRGVAIAAAMVLLLMVVAPKPVPEALVNSRLAPSLVGGARCAAAVAPDEVRMGFRQACRDLERVVPPRWQRHLPRLDSI